MSNPTNKEGQVEDSKPLKSTMSKTTDDKSTKQQHTTPEESMEERRERQKQEWIDEAFSTTTELLERLPEGGASLLAPMPSVVSLRNVIAPQTPMNLRRTRGETPSVTSGHNSGNLKNFFQ